MRFKPLTVAHIRPARTHRLPQLILACSVAAFGTVADAGAATVNLPEFACNDLNDSAAGGTISWESGLSATLYSLDLDLTDGQSSPVLTECSSGGFSVQLKPKPPPPPPEEPRPEVRQKVGVLLRTLDTNPVADTPVNWTAVQQMSVVGEDQFFDTYFLVNLLYPLPPQITLALSQPMESNFFGFRVQTSSAFEDLGLVSIGYDRVLGGLVFEVPLQSAAGRLDLLSGPVVALPEPSTFWLVMASALASNAFRRRRSSRAS